MQSIFSRCIAGVEQHILFYFFLRFCAQKKFATLPLSLCFSLYSPVHWSSVHIQPARYIGFYQSASEIVCIRFRWGEIAGSRLIGVLVPQAATDERFLTEMDFHPLVTLMAF